MLIYLDNCCYNRPFDEQSNLIVSMETEAKLRIQSMIKAGRLTLVWSGMLAYENNDNPFWERKAQILKWEKIAGVVVEVDDYIVENAREYMRLGLKNKDAVHLACAIRAEADFFITTDKGVLNKPISQIEIINPIDFMRRELI